GAVSHMGVQLDSSADVVAHLARVRAAGLPVREEMGVSCCHANQDKFWVQDPDGVEWEIYHLNHDLEDEDHPAPLAPRLASRPATALPLAQTGACCGGPAEARPRGRPPLGARRAPRRRPAPAPPPPRAPRRPGAP